MKKLVILLLSLTCLLVMAGLGLFYLAEVEPFSCLEQPWFQSQHLAESWRMQLTQGPEEKTAYACQLAERRLVDLAGAQNPEEVSLAVGFLADALDVLVVQQNAIPAQSVSGFQPEFESLARKTIVVVKSLDLKENEPAAAPLFAFVSAMLNTPEPKAETPKVQLLPSVVSVNPVAVSYLDSDVDHSNFSMEGGHSGNCEDCHVNGLYAGTTRICAQCHTIDLLASASIYTNHFAGACENCHNTLDWTPTAFDHVGVFECQSCHAITMLTEAVYSVGYTEEIFTLPQGDSAHYPGECKRCHEDTEDWSLTIFEHTEGERCESCHADAEPPEHNPGFCQNCHQDMEDWTVIEYVHVGEYTCETCHTPDTPANHYTKGACVDCHTSETDWNVYQFAHQLYTRTSCVRCHTEPNTNHDYLGSCTNCHLTNTWKTNKDFHEVKSQRCITCHETIADHYNPNCDLCHSTTSWEEPFYHKSTNCLQCHTTPEEHYPGLCTDCHNLNNWKKNLYQHNPLNSCSNCHLREQPTNHYPGECSSCHAMTTWTNSNYSHTNMAYPCTSCHVVPLMHYSQTICIKCHNTQDWREWVFDHSLVSTNCLSCHATSPEHYTLQCSLCHNTITWTPAYYKHSLTDNCIYCHPAPTGHWPGQCSGCHNFTDWADVDFNHDGYNDCKSCHAKDRPLGHARGQCSNCHTTDSWTILLPTTAP